MGFKRADDAVVIISDKEVMAVRQGGRVEVWNPTGTPQYGNLSDTSTASDVKRAMAFHAIGHKAGFDEGVAFVRNAMHEALGLNKAAT